MRWKALKAQGIGSKKAQLRGSQGWYLLKCNLGRLITTYGILKHWIYREPPSVHSATEAFIFLPAFVLY